MTAEKTNEQIYCGVREFIRTAGRLEALSREEGFGKQRAARRAHRQRRAAPLLKVRVNANEGYDICARVLGPRRRQGTM